MQIAAQAQNAHALKGWRARAWAWVVFAALLKGLIPHAALASVAMTGQPALLWCAEGTSSLAGEVKATGDRSAAGHDCVCAAAGDGSLGVAHALVDEPTSSHHPRRPDAVTALAPRRLLSPPARGPPTI